MSETNQVDKIMAYLDRLTEATKLGQISWSEANPTTMVWENKDKGGRLVLQKLLNRLEIGDSGVQRVEGQYVLQGFDLDGKMQLVLKEKPDTSVNIKLKTLFEIATSMLFQKSIDFLGSIVPE